MRRIYLDNAAATPTDRRVVKAMKPYMNKVFGNPSSLHKDGILAKNVIERARESIAQVFSAHKDEIVFTSGGTESNNLAIVGVVNAFRAESNSTPHIVVSTIEHPSVLNTVKALESEGKISATYVPVGEDGIVDTSELKKSLRPETILVSVMYANNEIGTIQPIKEIAKIVRHFRKTKSEDSTKENKESTYPYLHTDACQAVNYLDVNVARLSIDLMTVSGAKIYGPKGVGALYVKRGTKVSPIIYGGGQESGVRPGTENTPAIAGLCEAVVYTEKIKESENVRLEAVRDYFIGETKKLFPECELNGDKHKRLPNNVHISIHGVDSEQLVIELDAKGVSVSSKSACKSRDEGISHVLRALSRDDKRSALGGIRFSMGRNTKKKDIDYVLNILPKIVQRVRNPISF